MRPNPNIKFHLDEKERNMPIDDWYDVTIPDRIESYVSYKNKDNQLIQEPRLTYTQLNNRDILKMFPRLIFSAIGFAHKENSPHSVICKLIDNKITISISRSLVDNYTFDCYFYTIKEETSKYDITSQDRALFSINLLLTSSLNPFNQGTLSQAGNYILSRFGKGLIRLNIDQLKFSRFELYYVPLSTTLSEWITCWKLKRQERKYGDYMNSPDIPRVIQTPIDEHDELVDNIWTSELYN